MLFTLLSSFFFFNDTATTEIYTLSLHDALPISSILPENRTLTGKSFLTAARRTTPASTASCARSEEHTSELQSHLNLVCRLLLEKKKKSNTKSIESNESVSTRYGYPTGGTRCR